MLRVRGHARRHLQGAWVLTRYPFVSAYRDFLASYEGVYSDGMMAELRRRYPKIGRQMQNLYDDGRISTTDPGRFTPEDVKEYVRFQRQRGLKPTSISHDISAIANLCNYVGNSAAVLEARARYPLLFPKRENKRLPVVERPQFEVIKKMSETLTAESDPRRIRAYAEVMLAFGIGPRTEELQHILVDNVSPDMSSVFLDFVKGRGTYGSARTVPIRPECLHAVRIWMEVDSVSSRFLFHTRNGTMLSTMQLTRDRLLVCRETGIDFDFRACRRTYAQYILDEERLSTEELAIILGHSSSKTTETSYARPRNDRVVNKLIDSWKESE